MSVIKLLWRIFIYCKSLGTLCLFQVIFPRQLQMWFGSFAVAWVLVYCVLFCGLEDWEYLMEFCG